MMTKIAERYAGVEHVVWAQEEPQNRGGWAFMSQRLRHIFPGYAIQFAGREAAASPAPGSLRQHQLEQEQVVRDALGLTGKH